MQESYQYLDHWYEALAPVHDDERQSLISCGKEEGK
jgi:hypothetical protein